MERRVNDVHVQRLIRKWLKLPVEYRDERGHRRLYGGKKHSHGTPQGVISPLLANLYMNRTLRGWCSYFQQGTRTFAYRAVDNFIQTAVRNFFQRRHKVPGRGAQCFPGTLTFGQLGVLRLRRQQLGKPAHAPA